MSTYTIYKAPGWHGEPSDPVIEVTDDEEYAAMMAGCRIDIKMPGNSNRYDKYAADEDGQRVDRVDSFACDSCGELTKWGADGPHGCMDGEVLECPEVIGKHLVDWVCEDCAYSDK